VNVIVSKACYGAIELHYNGLLAGWWCYGLIGNVIVLLSNGWLPVSTQAVQHASHHGGSNVPRGLVTFTG
jgi:hypothetical protein